MKYFHINKKIFDYNLEFNQNSANYGWKKNIPLIDYCKTLGFTIPHYCYHKNLTISGNCRMCLIEVFKSPKPIISCAVSAKSILAVNSKIFTNSPLVKKSRENILEFLLLNHPLDCPICDQGGQCDLQDQSLIFGISKKRFYNFKRIVVNKNVGPIIKTVMTRCIHCTKCIRFSNEIAGSKFLGAFGRGETSEITNFTQNLFHFEFYGTTAELCPVGALTIKPYAFSNRCWELKNISTIDYTDGFNLNIQIFLKNNKIVKILPGYNSKEFANNWISDKLRFSFDGMFSANRVFNGLLFNNNYKDLNWKSLFKELTYTFYFQDHLNNHLFKQNKLILLFNHYISVETLNFLTILSNQFTFIVLKKITTYNLKNNLDFNLQINNATNYFKLKTADLCVLIDINTKSEGTFLNLKLRQRYLKGNFKIFIFNSIIESNFKSFYITPNFKNLKDFFEGNHKICQFVKNSKKPLTIIGSNIFTKSKNSTVLNLLKLLKKHSNLKTKFWDGQNVLHNSINSQGVLSLKKIETINNKDFKHFNGLFFVDSTFEQFNKFIELKILNYLKLKNNVSRTLIQQNSKLQIKFIKNITKSFNFFSYIYLPNNIFFETSNTFLNTEGYFKSTTKCVSIPKNNKNNWQILRKLFSHFKKITYLNNVEINKKIQFNCNNLYNFKNYLSYLLYSSYIFTNLSFYLQIKIQTYNFDKLKFKTIKRKNVNFKLNQRISDFYVEGFDNYSKHSIIMLECSKIFRLEYYTFKFLTLTCKG